MNGPDAVSSGTSRLMRPSQCRDIPAKHTRYPRSSQPIFACSFLEWVISANGCS